MSSDATSPAPFEFRSHFAPRPHISHVVFDFDGTLSWLRHGWPFLMVDLFAHQIPLLPGESPEQLAKLLLNDVLSLNGHPSVHQIKRLADLNLERGGPPADPHEKLVEYQRRLDEQLADRVGFIQHGQAHTEDYVIHGARALLEELQRRRLTLIILSGTQEARVREEARLLRLEPFFGRHIYGSHPEHREFSKRPVIERLLREENIEGAHLLAFGDGPVEISVTKDVGGLAVGIASDEHHNGSGQADPHKHAQLAAAGADVLMADYRDFETLLDRLFGPRPDSRSAAHE
ncbi:MAG TPA: HAD family hydrolase [Methylomirabilota bacterium]|nr:HAD family hydrolase [Methylomirabilota bacterium]